MNKEIKQVYMDFTKTGKVPIVDFCYGTYGGTWTRANPIYDKYKARRGVMISARDFIYISWKSFIFADCGDF